MITGRNSLFSAKCLRGLVIGMCLATLLLGGRVVFCANAPNGGTWVTYTGGDGETHMSDTFYWKKGLGHATTVGKSYFNKNSPDKRFYYDHKEGETPKSIEDAVRLWHENGGNRSKVEKQLDAKMKKEILWNDDAFFAGGSESTPPDISKLLSNAKNLVAKASSTVPLWYIPEPSALVLPEGQKKIYYGIQSTGGGSVLPFEIDPKDKENPFNTITSVRGVFGYSPIRRVAVEGFVGLGGVDFIPTTPRGGVNLFLYGNLSNDSGAHFRVVASLEGASSNWQPSGAVGKFSFVTVPCWRFNLPKKSFLEVGANLGIARLSVRNEWKPVVRICITGTNNRVLSSTD